MTDQLTQILAGGALALLVLEKVFVFIKPLIQKPALTNGEAAGVQNKNWWVLTIGQLCKDSVVPVVEILIRIERMLIDIAKNQVDILYILRQVRADQRRRSNGEGEI